jgi:hypothetical protein
MAYAIHIHKKDIYVWIQVGADRLYLLERGWEIVLEIAHKMSSYDPR